MFHLRDGWFFERLEDGAVKITKKKSAVPESEVVAGIIIEPFEWASIVATVSQFGDNAAMHKTFLTLHGDFTGKADAIS